MTNALLADAWRITRAQISDAIFWINQHRKVLEEAHERPEYLRYALNRLEYHKRRYLEDLRLAHEYEEKMNERNMEFVR